jgi:hypothetical protein
MDPFGPGEWEIVRHIPPSCIRRVLIPPVVANVVAREWCTFPNLTDLWLNGPYMPCADMRGHIRHLELTSQHDPDRLLTMLESVTHLIVTIMDDTPVLYRDNATLQDICLDMCLDTESLADHYECVPLPQGKLASCTALTLRSTPGSLYLELNRPHLPSLHDLILDMDVVVTNLEDIPRLHLHNTTLVNLADNLVQLPALASKVVDLELVPSGVSVLTSFVNLQTLEISWRNLSPYLSLFAPTLRQLTKLVARNVANGTDFIRRVANAFPRLQDLMMLREPDMLENKKRLTVLDVHWPMPNLVHLDIKFFYPTNVDEWPRYFPRLQVVVCDPSVHAFFPIGPLWNPELPRRGKLSTTSKNYRFQRFTPLTPKPTVSCSGPLDSIPMSTPLFVKEE